MAGPPQEKVSRPYGMLLRLGGTTTPGGVGPGRCVLAETHKPGSAALT